MSDATDVHAAASDALREAKIAIRNILVEEVVANGGNPDTGGAQRVGHLQAIVAVIEAVYI